MSRPPIRLRSRGFSLVELLVAVTIGLVVTLAVFGVLAASEGRKRTSVALNDTNQSGAYAAYTVDRIVRSAGTGYAQGWPKIGSCRISAALTPAGETLPRTAAFPAPFTAVPQTVRLAPVVIFAGASDTGSDVLMTMSGTAGFGEAPAAVLPGAITATQVLLANTIGLRANDLVLLAGGGECLLSQVASTKALCAGDPTSPSPTTTCGQQLPLAGSYYTATGAHTSLTALAGMTNVNAFSIGNTTTNQPHFELLGVGANSTLFRHDLLLLNGVSTTSEPVAEGVRELHAVYGLDTNDDGMLDTWQSPTATGWTGAALMDGSSQSSTRLRQIVALRVALVMRSALIERELAASVPVAPASMPLFGDLPTAVQTSVDLTRTGENRNQRHRVIELTIPIRNLLMRTTS
ncbi:PilW family protein [uncultured Methylibium sp.]|uniref:PilW family protein n=1 Tax=uncultured Methylibium sp. TaxID=381093 RepID=UPI0025FF678A|nr:PilW family protein [uncultured Methylibium sp.]